MRPRVRAAAAHLEVGLRRPAGGVRRVVDHQPGDLLRLAGAARALVAGLAAVAGAADTVEAEAARALLGRRAGGCGGILDLAVAAAAVEPLLAVRGRRAGRRARAGRGALVGRAAARGARLADTGGRAHA